MVQWTEIPEPANVHSMDELKAWIGAVPRPVDAEIGHRYAEEGVVLHDFRYDVAFGRGDVVGQTEAENLAAQVLAYKLWRYLKENIGSIHWSAHPKFEKCVNFEMIADDVDGPDVLWADDRRGWFSALTERVTISARIAVAVGERSTRRAA